MMVELLKEKLALLPLDGWELTDIETNRWEFYYIGHKLDQNRVVKTHETKVQVYKKSPDGKFLGSATDVISPTASEADIDEQLDKLLFQAGLVRNPVYTLADKKISIPYAADDIDAAGIAGDCLSAMAKIDEEDGSRINSYEIFVSGIKRHTLNSNGVEYICTYPKTEIEVIVNAKDTAHEIELYRKYDSGTCDKKALTDDIRRVMGFGRDRLKAVTTPKLGKANVILSTADAVTVYNYFSDKMHADFVVRRLSDFKIGEPVAAYDGGDRLSIEAVSFLPNSSMNFPVDREGNQIKDRYLIRNGVAENYCGSRQFSQYLMLEESSLVTNLKVSGGSKSEDELRSGDYLEIVEFSDFQVNPMSGDIAGEIRLGYWHHDGVTQVVTGGSVSGSMNEAAKNMLFSKETVQYDNWMIPKLTLLPGLRVTGAGES